KEPTSLCVAQAMLQCALQPRTPGLKQSGGLSLPSSWDYRCTPPRPAFFTYQKRNIKHKNLKKPTTTLWGFLHFF
uniref:Uncharacterized protein n=1 Tax=Melopsittacus undulatus TaxID=13146 RepID=A0A8V5G9M1_MELUD